MSVWISPEPPSFGHLARGRFSDDLRRSLEQALIDLRLPIALSTGLVAGLVVLAVCLSIRPPDARPPALAASASVWGARPDAQPLVSLDTPGLSALPRRYEALSRDRTALGGTVERADRLTIGSFDGPGAWLRVVVRRAADAGRPSAGFFVDTVRQAADAGLALDRFGRAGRLVSRFGPVETASIAVTQAGAPVTSRADCAVLRFGAEDVALDFTALACPPVGRTFDESQLSCIVSRLDSIAAGDEPSVRRYLQAPRGAGKDAGCDIAPAAAVAVPEPRTAGPSAANSVTKSRH
jgi:hypothetical protein